MSETDKTDIDDLIERLETSSEDEEAMSGETALLLLEAATALRSVSTEKDSLLVLLQQAVQERNYFAEVNRDMTVACTESLQLVFSIETLLDQISQRIRVEDDGA